MSEAERLRAVLLAVANMLWDSDCDCVDPPEEREPGDERGTDREDWQAHTDSCPEYIKGFIEDQLKDATP